MCIIIIIFIFLAQKRIVQLNVNVSDKCIESPQEDSAESIAIPSACLNWPTVNLDEEGDEDIILQ